MADSVCAVVHLCDHLAAEAQAMERTFRLLICTNEPDGLSEYFATSVRAALARALRVVACECATVRHLRQSMCDDHDLAVLLLNNIIPDNGFGPFEENIWHAFDAVRRLSVAGVPVITLCPLSVAPQGIAGLARAAGARFHFPCPFPAEPFKDAVQQCALTSGWVGVMQHQAAAREHSSAG